MSFLRQILGKKLENKNHEIIMKHPVHIVNIVNFLPINFYLYPVKSFSYFSNMYITLNINC